MMVSHRAVLLGSVILCATVIRSIAGIGSDQPLSAVNLQSADALLVVHPVDLALADDWGMVGIDPDLVISVDPVESGAIEVCRVVWRDGQALVLGSVSQTRTRLGLERKR